MDKITNALLKTLKFAADVIIERKIETRASSEGVVVKKNSDVAKSNGIKSEVADDKDTKLKDGMVNAYKYPQVKQTLKFKLKDYTLERMTNEFASSAAIKMQSRFRKHGESESEATQWMIDNPVVEIDVIEKLKPRSKMSNFERMKKQLEKGELSKGEAEELQSIIDGMLKK